MNSNLKIILASTFLTLLGAEVGLRWMGVAKTFHEQKGVAYYSLYGSEIANAYRLFNFSGTYFNTNSEFSYAHKLNQHGFVGSPPKFTKSSYRILAFGDSFMEGVGALSPDSSIPALLQKIFQARGKNCNVFNFGNGGSDVVFQMKYIIDSVARFQPDLVIMMYNKSDIGDIIQWGGEERFQPNGTAKARSGPWFAWLYEHSRLVRLIIANGLKFDSELLISKTTYEAEQKKSLDIAIATAAKTAAFCKSIGSDFVFVLMPFGPDFIYQKEISKKFFGEMQQRLQEEGVLTVNLFEPMVEVINEQTPETYWWIHDGHYRNIGYELIANILADSLRL